MKVKNVVLTAVAAFTMGGAFVAAQPKTVWADFWQMRYTGSYKVRVTKPTWADKQEGNKFSSESHIRIVKRFKLRPGQVVYTSFASVNGIDWILASKRYRTSKKYVYECHFKKHSFKVIKAVKRIPYW